MSPLLFVICLMPLFISLRKDKADYDLGKNKGKINHLLYRDDLKLYAKSKKETDAIISTKKTFKAKTCVWNLESASLRI